jgi:hypothetical protein
MEAKKVIAELAACIAVVAAGKTDRPALAKRLRRLAERVEDQTPPVSEGARVDPHNEAALRLFEFWRTECGKGATTKATPDRIRKVKARLREGYTEAQIRTAIRGASAEAYEDERGHRYDDLELICRSGTKLEAFIAKGGGTLDGADDPKLAELERLAKVAQAGKRIDEYNRLQAEIRRHRGSARS